MLLHMTGGIFMNKEEIKNDMNFFEFDFEDNGGSDIETICLNCGYTEKVPDFIYDEMSRKKYHLKIRKKVSTLYCSKCQKQTAIPKSSIDKK